MLRRNMRDFMPGLNTAITNVQRLRRRFDSLLAAAKGKSPGAQDAFAPGRLRQLKAFGENPGNLSCFAYVPAALSDNPALVVALHGCTQTAEGFDRGTGWSQLAEREGFVVLYPQQQTANNPQQCFSWFLTGDIVRDCGEAGSIRQMVEHAVLTFGIDRRKVFVTGLSAGGAMASVMLATYPEVFAGGAIIAGLPYGCAASVEQAFEAMLTEHTHAAAGLGDRVRAASKHQGPWPRVSVWHGSADPLVRPCNAENSVRQWTNVHGLTAHPSHEEVATGYKRRIWNDADGHTVIEAFAIAGIAHGVPINSGRGAERCGAAGPFFLDVGISSSHHIAKFWGLRENSDTLGLPALRERRSVRGQSSDAAIEARAAATGVIPSEPAHRPLEANAGSGHPLVDANAVIADAFKAAGLPVPECPAGTARHVEPGPIIAAALKAAGLVK
jgi:poly(hydroxyalkanoate) depolymerase family esterase